MKEKHVFYSEIAYVIGIVILALGTVFMEKANFGMSMVVAPAYLIHLKVSQYLPFFSFGMAEYTLQAFILIIMTLIIRKAKLSFLFSFITAVFYGFVLDGETLLFAFISANTIYVRVALYLVGMVLCGMGVSLLFHTYIPPEAYELFVKEISAKFNLNINVFKTVYDCCSCVISIILSFAFFGLWQFKGIGIGTIICALLNGFIISRCSLFYSKIWVFKDKKNWRKFFI